MTDEPQARKSGLSWAVYAIAVGSVSLLLYLLSTGPFCWLVIHGYLGPQYAHTIESTLYAPITWGVENSEWVANVVEVWVSWWLNR